MFAFSSGRTGAGSAIEGHTVYLRHPEPSDYEAWAMLRRASENFLKPWEPAWPRDDLTRPAYRARLRRYQGEVRAGTGYPYFILRRSDDCLLGGITLGNIRRGASQSGQIGYWSGETHAGKGYMSQALDLLCEHAFTRFGLHRLEAACIPGNTRSERILEKCGFRCEGLLAGYLKINGEWRDHHLYARINANHKTG